ncbi:hypothetical protein C8A00DRAFT_37842 [Chaetomidium leptoderma]|uniref:Uncharacterized protein n=1 Tax=Chaetomidium leptoderma TaxID=669021 RepID=A0AAN6VDR1_9PEZI|nr:hypothetical protein C8A00DRAFT_37842 [Chaetomidium leptoderma]
MTSNTNPALLWALLEVLFIEGLYLWDLLLHMFNNCESFQQLASLIATSEQHHAVWVAHAPDIIWHVAPKIIPDFDHHLIEARLVAMWCESARTGLPPPEISPGAEELSGNFRKPSPAKLDDVLDALEEKCMLDIHLQILSFPGVFEGNGA